MVTCMNSHVPSLEFMSFQNDNFGEELAKKVNWLRIDGKYTSESVQNSGIAELINKRFNLNINVMVIRNSQPNAAMSIPPISKEHPLTQVFLGAHNYVGRLITEIGEKGQNLGVVDIKNAKCSGIFSKIPGTLYIHTGMLASDRFTPEEVAAVMLHEVGHLFTYFYYLLHSVMSTFVVSSIAAQVAGAKRDDERRFIIQKGAMILGIDNIAVDPMLHQTADQNAATLQTLYIRDTTNLIRSETGASLYESKSAEQLADLFAVKMGMAKPLATGLAKFSPSNKLISTAFKYVALAVTGVFTVLTTILSFGAILPIMYLQLLLAPSDVVSPYDSMDNRIKLIRQHLIQELKDTPDEDKKKIGRAHV